ncbi:MAG: hypothetical protein JXK07_12925 [Spirochaetes bacterium]|nr:hypothetical protein [Spirochaetota bacterium]MBN2770477.1 hypothetical protein [Spirochaetota bacterium]
MYRIKNIFLLVLIFSIYNCSRNGSENEPNNSFDTSTPVTIGKKIAGSIESAEDIDFFKLDVDRETRISISLSQLKGINHSITIFRDLNGKQTAVKRVDDSRKSSPEKMPCLGLIPGTYYIVVSHGERDEKKGSDQKYYLLIDELVQDENFEFEPNDTQRLATPVTSGNSISGFHSPSFNKLNKSSENQYREYDYFSFKVSSQEAGRYLADISVSGVPGVDVVLAMYNPSGQKINSSDVGIIGTAESIIGQGLSDAGNYIIEICAKDFASNNDTPYTLNVNVSEFDSSFEMELNNSVESANVLRGSMIKGRIFPEGDEDYFVYIPSKPGFVDITLVPTPEINGRMALYNAEGDIIFEIDNHEAGMTENFPAFFTGEKLYIRVTAFSGEVDSEKYYSLYVKESAQQESVELEPNDEKDRATFIEKEIMYGYSSYRGDRDFYLIETKLRAEKIIRITGVEQAHFEISVTDNLGYVINSYELKDGNVLEITELVDKRAYLIIDAKEAVFDRPYIIEMVN